MNQLYNLPGPSPERRASLPAKFSNFKKYFLMLAFLVCALYSNAQLPTTGFQTAEGKSFSFPASVTTLTFGPNCTTTPGSGNVPNSVGRTIINVTDFGANGNDQIDDTEAFRRVFSIAAIPIPGTDRFIQPSSGIFVYIPNGTYLFSDSIGFAPDKVKTNTTTGNGGQNIQMWGQSRTNVILKLKDGTFTDANSPHAFFNTGGGAPDRFNNTIQNVTFEVGANNAGAIGLRHYLSNLGGLYNVTIKGPSNSLIGLDKGYERANGPSLTKDVRIEGFKTGIRTSFNVESEVYEYVTLKNQSERGWFNKNQVLSIRGLKVEGCAGPAFVNESGFVNLLESELQGNGASAIRNGSRGRLLIKKLRTISYGRAVEDPQRPVNANDIPGLYLSRDGVNPDGSRGSDIATLDLAIKETPIVDWDNNPVNVAEFGATAQGDCSGGDPTCRPCDDDTDAIQRAIDAMNDPTKPLYYGRTTLLLNSSYRIIKGGIRVGGHVKRIMSLGWNSTAQPGDNSANKATPSWIVEAGSSPIEFNNFQTGSPNLDNNSTVVRSTSGRTIIFKNCDIQPNVDISNGEVFFESCAIPYISLTNAKTWARQLDPEKTLTPKLTIAGGTYWGLGLKTEQTGPVIRASNRAQVELYGAYLYSTHNSAPHTMFELNNAQLTVSMTEYWGAFGTRFNTLVSDIKGTQAPFIISAGAATSFPGTYPAVYSQFNDSTLYYKLANGTCPPNTPNNFCIVYNANKVGSEVLLYSNFNSTTPRENWVMVDDQIPTMGNHTLTYTGTWSRVSDIRDLMGTFSHTATAGSTARLEFTGDKFTIYARKRGDAGIMNVVIDGGQPQQVDLYAAGATQRELVYDSPVLTAGPHSVVISYTGNKNASSVNPTINIDAIEYRATSGSTIPVTSISVTAASSTISTGGTTTVTANVQPSNATDRSVTWSTSNNLATVNAAGQVTAGSTAGQVEIIARASNGVEGRTTINISAGSGGGFTYLQGSGFYQRTMTTANQEVTKVTSSAIGDNNLSTYEQLVDDNENLYQAAGLTWTTAQSGISKVELTHGTQTNNGSDNGNYSANIALQYQTTAGGAWTNAPGWTLSPTYPYDYRVSDQTYTFQGTALPGVVAIRIVGQVHTNNTSWSINVREIRAYTSGGGTTPPPPSTSCAKTTGTVIGTTGSWGNDPNSTRDKAMDNNTGTFFDAPTADGNWVGLDLGTAKRICKVRFYPRDGFASRMVGGRFQASSSPTFNSNNVNLTAALTEPASGQWTEITVTNTSQFQYVRYLSPNGGYGNVAEVEFFTSSGTTQTSSVNDANQQLQLNQNTLAENITVFPNPVTDGWLTVGLTSADKNNKVEVSLADLSGRIVYKNSFTSNGISERLNIGSVQAGVYVIRVSGANTKFSSKVVIQ